MLAFFLVIYVLARAFLWFVVVLACLFALCVLTIGALLVALGRGVVGLLR